MQNPGAVTFLVLFALSTLLTYLSVRRGWLTLGMSTTVGAAANVLFFILFSLAQGNGFPQALTVGAFLGLLFTGMAVAMAAFFKSNYQAPETPVSDPPPPA